MMASIRNVAEVVPLSISYSNVGPVVSEGQPRSPACCRRLKHSGAGPRVRLMQTTYLLAIRFSELAAHVVSWDSCDSDNHTALDVVTVPLITTLDLVSHRAF
jgi:hypothetical protein